MNSASVKGTLVAYATSPGKVASDGDARNGLYTKHLLQHIVAPGIPVEQVFKRVLQGVERDSNGQQSPLDLLVIFRRLLLPAFKTIRHLDQSVICVCTFPIASCLAANSPRYQEKKIRVFSQTSGKKVDLRDRERQSGQGDTVFHAGVKSVMIVGCQRGRAYWTPTDSPGYVQGPRSRGYSEIRRLGLFGWCAVKKKRCAARCASIWRWRAAGFDVAGAAR